MAEINSVFCVIQCFSGRWIINRLENISCLALEQRETDWTTEDCFALHTRNTRTVIHDSDTQWCGLCHGSSALMMIITGAQVWCLWVGRCSVLVKDSCSQIVVFYVWCWWLVTAGLTDLSSPAAVDLSLPAWSHTSPQSNIFSCRHEKYFPRTQQ